MDGATHESVFVTGASSGIGRASVDFLANAGWQVFAAVRKAEDARKLESEFGRNVTAVIMDVTDRNSIREAAAQVSLQLSGRGLHGLVNVAGIGMVRPVEYAGTDDLQKIFDINVFGQIAVTQAFLPMVRQARGRIVNITSIGVNIALPFGGLLNASKSAFAKISDTLRLELRPFGVRVIAIEPGAIKTPAVEKTLGDMESVIANLPAEGATQYGEMMTTFARRGYQQEMSGSPPEVVADAVLHALTSPRPRIRYRVGKHAKVLSILPKVLPDSALDAFVLRLAGMPTKLGALSDEQQVASCRLAVAGRRRVERQQLHRTAFATRKP